MKTIWLADYIEAEVRRVPARPVVGVFETPGSPRSGGYRVGGARPTIDANLRLVVTGETSRFLAHCRATARAFMNRAQGLTTRLLFLVGVACFWWHLNLLGGRDRARGRAARCGRGSPSPGRQPAGLGRPRRTADRLPIGRRVDAGRDRQVLARPAISGPCTTLARGSARLGPLGAAPGTRALAARGGREPDDRRNHAKARLGGPARCARAPGLERIPDRVQCSRGPESCRGGFVRAGFG